MFKSIILRTKSELLREKQKDYKNIVIIQIVIITFGLTLTEFILEGTHSAAGKVVILIFSLFGAVYMYLLWDLLRNFTRSRALVNIILVVLVAGFTLALLSEFPYYRFLDPAHRRIYLLITHGLLFPIEVIVIGYAIADIFSGEFLTPDKLWGSACIFLMIGIAFGGLFHLICLVDPTSLGDEVDIGAANYSECVTYSLSILGGVDPTQPDASHLIKNISVLEGVWGNLYVVLIIGKLMGLPRPAK